MSEKLHLYITLTREIKMTNMRSHVSILTRILWETSAVTRKEQVAHSLRKWRRRIMRAFVRKRSSVDEYIYVCITKTSRSIFFISILLINAQFYFCISGNHLTNSILLDSPVKRIDEIDNSKRFTYEMSISIENNSKK